MYTLGAMQVVPRAPARAPAKVAAPTTTPVQQPVVVVVPAQKQQAEKETEAPGKPWYKSTAFVGSVASAIALALASFAVKKLGGDD